MKEEEFDLMISHSNCTLSEYAIHTCFEGRMMSKMFTSGGAWNILRLPCYFILEIPGGDDYQSPTFFFWF